MPEMNGRGQLIVLSGEAGAGKDAVAKILVEKFGWTSYSLAGPLKRFAEDMFMFSKDQCYGPSSARNAPDPRWARPCKTCARSGYRRAAVGPDRDVKCEVCGGTGLINDNSPRRVLQLLGEEYLREMIHVDALTMRARGELEAMMDSGIDIVVNDARNDNDRNNLHDWLDAWRVDVRSIRCSSAKKASQPWRQHVSEQRQATDDAVEFVIQNDEEWPFPSLPTAVDEMLLTMMRKSASQVKKQ